jgi:tetratricopeptide (TPR) repeat protein
LTGQHDAAKGFPASPGGPSSWPRASSSLPPETPDFIGREEVLTALNAILDQPEDNRPRAVVVEGMPGVGKTALTIHWAHLVREKFPGGYLYIDLRGHADQDVLTEKETLWQMLIALGVPGGQIPEPTAARAAAYQARIAGKKILLILDNARDEDQVRALLPRSAGPLAVVTSRNHLRELARSSEVLVRKLGVFTPDEALALLTSIIGEQRVSYEPGAAKELVEICGYLPLALRIVAANLVSAPDATLAEYVANLEQAPLSGLTLHNNRSIAVRNTLDLSYRGLEDNLRRTFRLLGLAEGRDISSEAAAALLNVYPEESQPLLTKLRLANLIEMTAPGRYRLHDLLHDYARERSTTDDDQLARTEAIQRLLNWYLTTARAMGDFLGQQRRTLADLTRVPRSAADQSDRDNRLAWFEDERQNLVAAVRQAASAGEDSLAWELADAMYDFLQLRSYAGDNVEVHRIGLTCAQRAGELRAQVYMRHHLSAIRRDLGQYPTALDEAEKALAISTDLKDRYLEAAVRNNLAAIYYLTGRYADSLQSAERALAIRQAIEDRIGEAQSLTSIGRTQRALGRYRESFANTLLALTIRQEIHDRLGEAETFDALARLYRLSGLYSEALTCGYLALEIRRELGDRIGEGESLQSLARVYRRLGVYSQAREYAARALEIMDKVGNTRGVAEAHATLGDIYLESSRDSESDALDEYNSAMDIRIRIGDPRRISESSLSLARAYRRRGDFERAQNDASRALTISRAIGDRFGEARALDSLARAFQLTNQYRQALRHAEQALEIQRDIGDRRGEGDTLDNLARIYYASSKYTAALECATEAYSMLSDVGDRRGQAKSLSSIAAIQFELGEPEAAIKAARNAAETWAELGDQQSVAEALDVLVKIANHRGMAEAGSGSRDSDPPIQASKSERRGFLRSFADGFGGIFDFFDTAPLTAEPLPSFESTLAEDVHTLCLASGLVREGDEPNSDSKW